MNRQYEEAIALCQLTRREAFPQGAGGMSFPWFRGVGKPLR